MKNFFLIAGLISIPFAGFAQDSGSQTQSEIMHQAEAGTFELRPSVGLGNFHYEYKTNNAVSSSNTFGFALGGAAEYGLSEMFAIGLSLNYQDFRTKFNTKPNVTVDDTYIRGLMDPSFYLNGRVKTESGWFKYGVSLNVPVEKSKTDGKTSNLAGEGLKVTPYVGTESLVGPGYLGARLSYDIHRADRDVEDTSTTPSTTSKKKDGQVLNLGRFYEWIINPFIDVGFALSYTDYAETKTEAGGTTTSDDNRSAQVQSLVYVPMHFRNGITLIPNVAFGSYTKFPSNTLVDSASYFLIGTSARFVF